LERRWRLGTRPAYPAVTRQWRQSLDPGGQFRLDTAVLDHLVPPTVAAVVMLTDHPPINAAQHVRALYAYPYGCLEQTTSGIYPQVFLDADTLARLKIKGQPHDQRLAKIAEGVARIVALQQPSGGFGLWRSSSPEEPWLTAYAADFLISARERGFQVPAEVLQKALQRLNTYLRRPQTVPVRYSGHKDHTRLSVQSYAGFVLARLAKAPLGTLRTLLDNHEQEMRSGLPLVHLGLALALQGDRQRAEKAFNLALARERDPNDYLADYGSPVRDSAMSYFLLSRYAPDQATAGDWLVRLERDLVERRWLSTQERNALVLAAMEMTRDEGSAWQAVLHVDGSRQMIRSAGTVQLSYGYYQLTTGLGVAAGSERRVYVNVLLSGYSDAPPPAESHRMDISRSYFDLEGRPADPGRMKTGDLLLVKLDLRSDQRVPEALVVDMLPAGLELENQNLSASFNMDHIEVAGKSVAEWKGDVRLAHEAFRDDRYVAALDTGYREVNTLFYLARAVSPGTYRV
ncbi:MAG: alpha-2-macroglobulin family protein, partial [Anaerolineae bacterium]